MTTKTFYIYLFVAILNEDVFIVHVSFGTLFVFIDGRVILLQLLINQHDVSYHPPFHSCPTLEFFLGDSVDILPCPDNMTRKCLSDQESKKRSYSVQETTRVDLPSSGKHCNYNNNTSHHSRTFRSLSDHLCILRKSFLR